MRARDKAQVGRHAQEMHAKFNPSIALAWRFGKLALGNCLTRVRRGQPQAVGPEKRHGTIVGGGRRWHERSMGGRSTCFCCESLCRYTAEKALLACLGLT